MPASRTHIKPAERPTLPSIHELNLLPLSTNVPYDHHDNMKRGVPVYTARRLSTSSSQTGSSRNASPTPSLHETPSPVMPCLPKKVRLAPCSLDEAQAIIYIHPRRKSVDAQGAHSLPHSKKDEVAVLITGRAVETFRRSFRGLEKGCKMQSYRLVDPRSIESRRASVISLNAEALHQH
ncbi:hypothetical protein CPC08DRAFT_818927 [Agrocybe pediades]|nr:hypothetical protein CPC08DRAFT_818927 [Agrocybe pediades]